MPDFRKSFDALRSFGFGHFLILFSPPLLIYNPTNPTISLSSQLIGFGIFSRDWGMNISMRVIRKKQK